ncbi:flagellar basal body L-ring protein FlgH [Thermosulfuriphilus sp.]
MRGQERSKVLFFFLGILVSFWASGCSLTKQAASPPVAPPPLAFPTPTPERPPEGSIFAGGSSAFLFEDHKAKRVGDVVTVQIVESYRGTNDVSSKSQRKSSTSAGVSALLGFEKALESANPRFSASKMFGGEMTNTYDGYGRQSRQAQITASISARVTEVLPNGNLVIQGVRVVKLSDEYQYLTISGIIRPEDINPDNTILSTKVADAHIEYSGVGSASEAGGVGIGWLARILQIIWMF